MPTTDKPTVTVNFRKLLLNRCQKEFEKDKDDDEIFEKRQKEMDDASAVSWAGSSAGGWYHTLRWLRALTCAGVTLAA